MNDRRWLVLSIVVALVGIIAIGIVVQKNKEEHRYIEGVLDGQCERDCQYTHDGGLEANVTGKINGYGDCVCSRWLGEPDWDR